MKKVMVNEFNFFNHNLNQKCTFYIFISKEFISFFVDESGGGISHLGDDIEIGFIPENAIKLVKFLKESIEVSQSLKEELQEIGRINYDMCDRDDEEFYDSHLVISASNDKIVLSIKPNIEGYKDSYDEIMNIEIVTELISLIQSAIEKSKEL